MMPQARTIIKLCLILLIIQSVSCDWMPNNKEKETLCKTVECKARGDEYKKNLNTKANPCQDFYTFTCGNWLKSHPGPKYHSEWNILHLLNIEIFNIIRKILESYKYQRGDDIKFRRAKSIYEYCVKIPEYPMKDAKDIAQEITKIGRVPTTPLWDIYAKYIVLSGESALFRTKIMTNPVAKELPLLMLLEPHSAYGSIYHEEVWKPQEKQAYTDFLFLIIKSLKLKDSDTVIRERIEKVFQFREKLNLIIQQNKKEKPDDFSTYSAQELDNWFSQTIGQNTNTQKTEQEAGETQPQDMIAIRRKKYFDDLMNLLKTTTEEVLASHMEIYFVERHLKMDDEMYKLLEGTSVEPHSYYTYIRTKYYPKWYLCLEDLNVKKTLEKLLYQKWFPKDYTDIIHAMNSKVKSAIEDQMEKSTWLDTTSRKRTTEKLKNVEEWIGFPPWVETNEAPTLVRNEDEILTAQAYLTHGSNVLYVQAPLLLPPVFGPTLPHVYNYAGMGATLGHELYHVIYDCGQYEIKDRKIVWWELATRNECIKRKQQFIDVYNKITDRELENRYNSGLKSDTTATVLEDIPDVMGLEAAYNAYKELLLKDKSVCQTLPNFENFNCDQMFYIAFANTFCGFNTRKNAEAILLRKAAHSLDSIRINGAVAQMKNFGTAFDCPVGSPMNPQHKLDLWH